MLKNWLHRLVAPAKNIPYRRPRPLGRRGTALRVERLEDRLSPAVSWINASGGSWDTPENWDTGEVPTANDDVIIDMAGADNYEVVIGGTAVAQSLFSAAGVRLTSGGTLQGGQSDAVFTAAGGLTVTGGTLDGVTLVNVAGGTATLSGSVTMRHGAVIENAGTFHLNGNLYLRDGALFDNQATGTLVLGNTGVMWHPNGEPSAVLLRNSGAITKPAGTGEAGLLLPIDSSGTITLGSGSLSLGDHYSNGASTFTGTVTGEAGTLIYLTGGTSVMTFADDFVADRVHFWDGAGAYRFEGAYQSNWSQTAGNVTMADADIGELVGGGGSLKVTGAFGPTGGSTLSTLSLLGPATGLLDLTEAEGLADHLTAENLSVGTLLLPANVASLEVTGNFTCGSLGSLHPDFVVTNSGNLTLTGGTLDGVTLVNVAGGTATLSGSVTMRHGAVIENAGTFHLNGNLYLRDGALFDNQATGTLVLGNTGVMWHPNGEPSAVLLRNSGAITKPAGTGEAGLLLPIDSSGTITLGSGSLSLGDHYSNGASTFTGTVTGEAGTLIYLTGGTSVMTFADDFVADRVHFWDAATHHFAGAYQSNWSLYSGAAVFSGNVDFAGKDLIGGGTFDLSAANLLAPLDFRSVQYNGTVITPAAASISGTVSLRGAWLGAGDLTIHASASGSLGSLQLSQTLINEANLSLSGIISGSASARLVNLGTLRGGAMTVNVWLDNQGAIELGAGGYLIMAGGGSVSGSIVALAPLQHTEPNGAQLLIRGSRPVTFTTESLIDVGGFGISTLDTQLAVNVTGAFIVHENLWVDAGRLTATGGVNWNGIEVGLRFGGVIDVSGAAPAPGGLVIRNFIFGSTFLSGAHDVHIAGDGNLATLDVVGAGTFGDETLPVSERGALIVDAGANGLLGHGIHTQNQPLVNYGQLSLTGGIDLADGITVTNELGATLTLVNAVINYFSSTGTQFINDGLLIADGHQSIVAALLANGGVIEVRNGTLILQGGYAQRPGTSGTLPPNPGPVANGGTIVVQDVATVTAYTQTVTGTLLEQIGGVAPGEYGQITVTGPVSLAGNLEVQLVGGFVPTVHVDPALKQKFVIIRNDGTDAVAGAFANWADDELRVDGFIFTISYAGGDGNDVVLTVDRLANQPPTASGASVTTDEDTPFSGSLPAADPDGDDLTFTLVACPAHGDVTFDPDTGAYTYTSHEHFNGTDSFTYFANDGVADSNVATVSITVTPVNDQPTSEDGSTTTAEDSPLEIDLRFLVDDVETAGADLAYALAGGPTHGTLTPTATHGIFLYTPDADYNGSDSFNYHVTDTGDAASPALTSETSTVSITITAMNDVPVAGDVSVTAITTATTIAVLDQATDVDGDTLTVVNVTQGARGMVTINSDGTVTYTLTTFFSGTDMFTYTVSDGHGGSATATVTVDVQLPPAEIFDVLEWQIENLTITGDPNDRLKKALKDKLTAAAQSLERSKGDEPALGQLGALINQLNGLAPRQLDQGEANALVAQIDDLMCLIKTGGV